MVTITVRPLRDTFLMLCITIMAARASSPAQRSRLIRVCRHMQKSFCHHVRKQDLLYTATALTTNRFVMSIE